MGPVTTRQAAFPPRGPLPRRPAPAALLATGGCAFAAALAAYLGYRFTHPQHWTLYPVDLGVYQSGGLIVRHVRPLFDPHLATPLYGWPGYDGLHLKFTYPPFAAVVFAGVSLVPWPVLPDLSVAVNIGLLLASAWIAVRALGWRGARLRPGHALGAALLLAAAGLWTEPVIRTLYLGQVNLALMTLILWDLTQPGTRASRWWQGSGVGVAAGIKLVPLIFVPYLLLTRRYRQAAVAVAAFAATVAIGWAVMPADSSRWWLHGLFVSGGRTGFVGWEGNQSLQGLITRLAGSVAAAQPVWLAAAAVTAVVGLAAAARLSRAGHELAGLLACALTGLLVSPVSWDHHWVWVVPGIALAVHYGRRPWQAGQPREARQAGPAGQPREARQAGHAGQAVQAGQTGRWQAWGCWGLAAGMWLLYAAWPDPLLGLPSSVSPFAFGLLWGPPNTDPSLYYRYGDQRWFYEYHWHGLQLLTGNAFVLGGMALLAVLAVAAVRTRTVRAARRASARAGPGRWQPSAAAPRE